MQQTRREFLKAIFNLAGVYTLPELLGHSDRFVNFIPATLDVVNLLRVDTIRWGNFSLPMLKSTIEVVSLTPPVQWKLEVISWKHVIVKGEMPTRFYPFSFKPHSSQHVFSGHARLDFWQHGRVLDQIEYRDWPDTEYQYHWANSLVEFQFQGEGELVFNGSQTKSMNRGKK